MDNNFNSPQVQDISQQRKFADLLRQQSMQELKGQMIGDRYVAPSWTQQLAKVLQGGLAGYTDSQANNQEKAYNANKSKQLADIMAGNKPQQIAGAPTLTTSMPAYTPDQQDQFGSPLPSVQREPVTTSTPNMTTETPEQQMQRVRPQVLKYMDDFGATPASQDMLSQMGKQDDRAYANTQKLADYAHQDANLEKAHTYDAGIYDKRLTDTRADTQTGYANAANVNAANHAFTTSERVAGQGFTAGQAANKQNFDLKQAQIKAEGDAANSAINPADLASTAAAVKAGMPLNQIVPGMGKDAAKQRNLVRNEAIRQIKEETGVSDVQAGAIFASKQAEYFGEKAGQRVLGTKSAQTDLAVNEAQQMIPLALKASDEYKRSGIKSLNDLQIMVDKNTASPQLRTLNAAVNAVVNTTSRAINPQGVPTDSDKAHIRDILNSAFSTGDFKAATDQLQLEMGAAQSSPHDVKLNMRSEFTGIPKVSAAHSNDAHPQDIEAINYAKLNPNDPRSKAILKANGL